MLKIGQAVIVEGKYDKIKLQSVIDAYILVTNGFGIFKDKEKKALIRAFAEKDGIIILTDSDHAGFQIRNHIKGFVNNGKIYNIYIPDVFGKEKRKLKHSAEGKLGVEGIDIKILENAFNKYGIVTDEFQKIEQINKVFTKELLFDDKLIGCKNSNFLRKELIRGLNLPENLSTSSLIDVLNSLYTFNEYKNVLISIKSKQKG